ncbi:MAG: class I SAM-dependent methyltransferase [Candidatus Hinthialibacter antarcticus]|nr:class I SAM-dependent methyltransferase [Candidatus Hinthialibacter antarcticus]
MQLLKARIWLGCILAIALLALPNAALCREYMGRSIAQTMHYSGAEWLMRESRQREESTGDVIANLGVKPGMTVCDFGSGNGFYTLKLAERVGESGSVFAVDIQQEMLDLLRMRANAASVKNVTPVLSTQNDAKLPKSQFDLILMVDVYHELSHPQEMLQALRASLKPKGRIALLEYREEDADVPIKPLHKMSKRQILKEYTANGFQLAGEYDGLPWQHMMFFERVESE